MSTKKSNVLKTLKVGGVFSETSFYTVKEIRPTEVVFNTEIGVVVTLGNPYVEQLLNAADYVESEVQKTKTELAEILLANPRVAMTVCFVKADQVKGKRAFEAEKAAKIAEIKNASLANAEQLLSELIENPISRTIPGEVRIMKGRHHGHVDDLGRVHFIDMEKAKGTGTHDDRLRQIDPRTIQYIILDKVKYILK